MYTSVLHMFSYIAIVYSDTMIKKSETMDIASKNQISIEPLVVTCTLADIIIVSAPVVAGKKVRYHLTNPRGDVRQLNITRPRYKNLNPNDNDVIKVTFMNKTKVITPVNNYKVFNVNFGQKSNSWDNTEDIFGKKESEMEANEFMIGPVGVEDYGNWEVGAVYKNDAGEWAEVYQIITLDIMEIVPATSSLLKLRPGETFELGFAYPIPSLESCQLVVPKSAFDRFYDRNQAKLDTCGYVVKNVTLSDSGFWSIIGVGRIAYHATVHLTVTPPPPPPPPSNHTKS